MSQNNFRSIYKSDYCVIRIPLLSINVLKDFFSSVDKSNSSKLREIYSSPLLQEAIQLASIDLFSKLEKYLKNEVEDRGQISKIESSLLQYFLRSSSRCTPFGIFATVSHCFFGDHTDLKLKINDPITRHVRTDSQILYEVIDRIVATKGSREQLDFVSNNSLYKLGKKFRYFEHKMLSQQRIYNLTSISNNLILSSLIDYGKKPKSFTEFQDFLINNGYEAQESKDFINILIDEEVLVAKIKDHVSGNTQIHQLLKQLNPNIISNPEILPLLKQLDGNNWLLSELPSQKNSQIYSEMMECLKPFTMLDKQKSFLQINGYRNLQAGRVNKKVIPDINSAIRVLCSLSVPTSNRRLVSFKKKFEERYGNEQVPLALALDPDIGLGNIFSNHYRESDIESHYVTGLKKEIFLWKHRQLTKCLSQSSENITVDPKDLPVKDIDYNSLPDSFYTIINLFVDRNGEEKTVFQFASGDSSTKLFGRFCHDSDELYNLTKKEIKKEEGLQPEKVFAEVVHLPQPRLGNVISRPQLREYEILYLGESSIDEQHRITIDDLFLRIIDDELELWSKKLNKIVIPKSTTALNHKIINLPIFQFLCEMPIQKPMYQLKWDWEIMSEEEFLPRVSFKNIILSPRIWNMSLSKTNKCSSTVYLEKFLNKYKVPDFVILSSGENGIILNIKDFNCRKIVLKTLEAKGRVVLKEAFIEDYDSVVSSGSKKYMNEIVVPFHKVSSEKNHIIKKQHQTRLNDYLRKTQRDFPLGSEWLYTKIYTGENAATEMLISGISRLANKLLKLSLIDKWFFIRYSDNSGFHIRLRLHVKRKDDFSSVLNHTQLFLNKQLSQKIIWNFTFDIYRRELERYSPYMEVSEELFYFQSIFTVKVLKYSKDLSLLKHTAIFALIEMVDNVEADNTEFLNNTLSAFKKEFDLDRNYYDRKQLEKDHRSKRIIFMDIIKNGIYNCEYLSKHKDIQISLKEYSNRFKKVMKQSCTEQSEVKKLLPSLIHMLVNRIFDSNPRKHELAIYYNAVKFYEMKRSLRVLDC